MNHGKQDDAATQNEYALIHVLPNEVLSLIFKQACDIEGRMEINISRACRRWRDIALSTAELWAKFTYYDKLPNSEVERLVVYLERSRNQPLDLQFNILVGNKTSLVEQLLFHSIQHVSRWRHFSLAVNRSSWPDDRDMFLPIVDVAAPQLQSFEVFTEKDYFYQDSDNYEPSTDLLRYIFKGGAPVLSCVRLDNDSMWGCMPQANITTLEIESKGRQYLGSLAEFLGLFALPLINLSLVGATFNLSGATPSRPMSTNTLKVFRCGDAWVAHEFWRWLRAPQLEVLIVRDTRFYTSVQSAPDNFPSLHSFSLVDCYVEELDVLLSLAHATECVTHLYIGDPCEDLLDDGRLLQFMVENSGQTILWPHLDTLTYVVGMSAEDDDEEVNWILKSYLEFFEHRATVLKKRCILELQPNDAKFWADHDLQSWKLLQEGGFYREMESRGEGKIRYFPWPLTKFEELHRLKGLEDPFLEER